MAVQLQWGLEHTTFSTLKGARDLIHAASTDNVQVKAILACEGFGATIAMYQETCRKIELTVVPAPSPVLLNFVASVIGYSAGDCMSQLSKSLAGIQFLGLATALVSTLPIHQAGDLVASMLVNSAADKALVPSRRQTIDILKSIEGRCYRAAFAEDIIGWGLLLGSSMPPSPTRLKGSITSRPGNDGIESLVDAFRLLHRVGESNISMVSIRTGLAIPWTIAFVKWCLGLPPSIVLEDGTCILSQQGSQVEVIVSQNDPSVFEVRLYSSLACLSTLVNTKVDRSMLGMIGVSSYGKLLLQDYHLEDDFTTRVIGELIPFCAHSIMHNLVVFGDDPNFDNPADESNVSAANLHSQRLSPFPDETAILETCGHLLGRKIPTKSRPLPDGLTIFELPLLKQHIDNINAKCTCTECSGLTDSSIACLIEHFVYGITIILGTSFVLSLFDRHDSLLVRASEIDHMGYRNSFGQAIKKILRQNSPFPCSVSEIRRWALWLLRHDEVYEEHWLMSCNKDQTIWPMIYETTSIPRLGYLRLLWLPGKLSFQNDAYNVVVGKRNNFARRGNKKPKITMAKQVSKPCNLFSGVTTRWQITPQDTVLEASILLNGQPGEYTGAWMFSSPHHAMTNIAGALLVDNCRHARDAELVAPDPYCVVLNPFHGSAQYGIEGSASSDDGHFEPELVHVIAVDGSDNLRFAALGMVRGDIPVVLRGNSCLSCCLKVCRQAGFPLLIL